MSTNGFFNRRRDCGDGDEPHRRVENTPDVVVKTTESWFCANGQLQERGDLVDLERLGAEFGAHWAVGNDFPPIIFGLRVPLTDCNRHTIWIFIFLEMHRTIHREWQANMVDLDN